MIPDLQKVDAYALANNTWKRNSWCIAQIWGHFAGFHSLGLTSLVRKLPVSGSYYFILTVGWPSARCSTIRPIVNSDDYDDDLFTILKHDTYTTIRLKELVLKLVCELLLLLCFSLFSITHYVSLYSKLCVTTSWALSQLPDHVSAVACLQDQCLLVG